MSGGEPSSIKRISDCEQVTRPVIKGSVGNRLCRLPVKSVQLTVDSCGVFAFGENGFEMTGENLQAIPQLYTVHCQL